MARRGSRKDGRREAQPGRGADSSRSRRRAGRPDARAETGRVVAHHGVAVLVRFEDGEERQVWLAPGQRSVVGDRVRVVGEKLETLAAHGILRRRDPRGRDRTIAVNLDLLAIVVAPEPREPPGYIDRGFVIARAAGIEPMVVMNKLDLEGGPALARKLAEVYSGSGAVHAVSAVSGEGLDAIRDALAGGRLGAMVGPSGVGKSSLLNALVPGAALRVGDLNRGSRKGRHTTTTATLHTLDGGGLLVDTAGFKDFIAVDLSPEQAAAHFPGFESALVEPCRFRDCSHRSEPDCRVRAALEAGEISAARHRAYCALIEELEAPPRPRSRG